jgi:hypothetical protein
MPDQETTSDQVVDKLKQDIDKRNTESAAQEKSFVKDNYYKIALGSGLSLAGNVAGILLAVKRKSGFWGGVGWFLVGGLAGAAIGYVAGTVLDGKPKEINAGI